MTERSTGAKFLQFVMEDIFGLGEAEEPKKQKDEEKPSEPESTTKDK